MQRSFYTKPKNPPPQELLKFSAPTYPVTHLYCPLKGGWTVRQGVISPEFKYEYWTHDFKYRILFTGEPREESNMCFRQDGWNTIIGDAVVVGNEKEGPAPADDWVIVDIPKRLPFFMVNVIKAEVAYRGNHQNKKVEHMVSELKEAIAKAKKRQAKNEKMERIRARLPKKTAFRKK